MNTKTLSALFVSTFQNSFCAIAKAFDASRRNGSEAALCPCLLSLGAARLQRSLRMRFSLILVVLAGLFSATYAHAGAVCTVTSTADSGAAGTLRYCIANGYTTIQITATGTITLNSALPTMTSNLSTFIITGPGANKLTVSGKNAYTVFTISSGSTSISGLTIANGSTSGNGGGILNDGGALTVTGVTFSGNTASDDGGGIYSTSSLTVNDCTFSSNTAENGGGFKINSSGTAKVTYSTFSGNKANNDGGGIASDATLTVTNSTITLNTAKGGVGGGILTTGATTLANSIVAGNTAATEFPDIDGNYADKSGNLASNDSIGISIDLELAPLANYGGMTNTQLPLPGSPAICDGLTTNLPAGVSTDQRGDPNTNTTYTSGTCVDSGAVQTNYQSVQFTNVPGGGAYTAATNVTPSPAPIVSVTENGQNIGAIPVTITDASSTVTGLGPETTVAGTGATFSSLEDSAVEDTTLNVSLQITPATISPAYTLSASAMLDTIVATPAALITPTPTVGTGTPGTQLPGTSVTFVWTPGNAATHFELWLGTGSPGTTNLYDSGYVTATTELVSNLPNNGETVYARLYWIINGTWHFADYTYKASAPSPTPAALITPTPTVGTGTPGTQLPGTSVNFIWTPGNTATHFELWLGTLGPGTTNLYNSGYVTATNENVSGLPSDGKTVVYARLYWIINGVWQYADYTYKAYGTPPTPTQAVLITPTPTVGTGTPGTQLPGTSVTFVWTPSNIVTHYELWLGTTGPGTTNLYDSGYVTATTETVGGLPSNGQKVYARLYTQTNIPTNGGWQYYDYTYKAY
jgi:predicted outer membrane repeat protein